jgi:hypothetical protein
MDFDTSTRGFALMGIRSYVVVDYIILIDSLGKESNLPCSKKLVGNSDDCAFKEECDLVSLHHKLIAQNVIAQRQLPRTTIAQKTIAQSQKTIDPKDNSTHDHWE